MEASAAGQGPLDEALLIWGSLMVAGFLLAFAGAVLLRNFGPVTQRPGGLLPGQVRTPVLAVAAVAIIALSVFVAVLAPVAAGAARAVDGSATSLALLWGRWATHLLGASGVLLIVAGLVEHLAMRRSLWRDLHMTPEQAREDARQLGGLSR